MNRFTDITPIEETAVVMNQHSNQFGKQTAQEYYNANFIKSAFKESHPADKSLPFGLIIAAQSPMDYQLDNYWNLVLTKNVSTIVSLCNNFGRADDIVGKDNKCGPQFFPDSSPAYKQIRTTKHTIICKQLKKAKHYEKRGG